MWGEAHDHGGDDGLRVSCANASYGNASYDSSVTCDSSDCDASATHDRGRGRGHDRTDGKMNAN